MEFSVRIIVKFDVACHRYRASGLAAKDSLWEWCHYSWMPLQILDEEVG